MIDGIGERLLDERRRLDWTQVEMAKAGGVALVTYGNYESGKRFPDAEFLSKLYVAGIDVLYVLTGVRNTSTLSNEQSAVLTALGRLDERARKAAVSALLSLEKTYNSEAE